MSYRPYKKKRKRIKAAKKRAREILKDMYAMDDVYLPDLAGMIHRGDFGLTWNESKALSEEVAGEIINEQEIV